MAIVSNNFDITISESVVTAPSYFPAVGGIVQANTNTVASLMTGDPSGLLGGGAPSNTDGIFNNWNGGAFGVYGDSANPVGRHLNHGGGHDTYYGNEVYELDFETRLWSRQAGPIPPSSWSLNYTFGEVATGQPMATHTYDHVQYWPNGGAKGEFLLLWHTSNHLIGGGVSNYTHHYDLATGVWRRQSGSIVSRPTPAESTSAYDAARDVFWGATQVSGIYRYDPNTESWTVFSNNSANFPLGTTSDIYPAGDAWILIENNSLWGIDLTSPSTFRVNLTQSGSGPNSDQLGFEWVPSLGEFAAFKYDTPTVWLLKPPSGDWRTGTWTWRTESISSSVVNGASAGQYHPMSQFRHISSITDGVYFSCTNGAGNCYVMRIAGP
jgi:hypothetical protein